MKAWTKCVRDLEKKQQEQEQYEKNQEIFAESRRSKTSKSVTRSDDGGEQRHPEKVILLAKGTKIPWANISTNHGGFKASSLHKAAETLQPEGLGQLSKEKISGAHKATTYFTKTRVNSNWDSTTVAEFSNKLAKYNVSFQKYLSSFQTGTIIANIETKSDTETEVEDNRMEHSSGDVEIVVTSPPPVLPPRLPVATIASGSTNMGFLTPQPPRSNKITQLFKTPVSNINSTFDVLSPSKHTQTVFSQNKKKNRIEPIDLPKSPFKSPMKHIPSQSQEYPY